MSNTVKALLGATAEDLAELRECISELQSELDAYVAEKKQSLDALKALEKILSIKVEGKPERKPREPGKAKGQASPTAERFYELLMREGSMPLPAAAAKLGTTAAGLSAVLRSASCKDWFASRNGEIHVARTKG